MTAPYDPSTPLRGDATDEQIEMRYWWLWDNRTSQRDIVIQIARELAAAVSAERDAEIARLQRYARSADSVIATLRTQLEAVGYYPISDLATPPETPQ